MPAVTQQSVGSVGEIVFTMQVFKDGKYYVARAPELDVASQGETIGKAKEHLLEAVEAFIEEAHRMGTLLDVLEEAGYERTNTGWKPRDFLIQEQGRIRVPQ